MIPTAFTSHRQTSANPTQRHDHVWSLMSIEFQQLIEFVSLKYAKTGLILQQQIRPNSHIQIPARAPEYRNDE